MKIKCGLFLDNRDSLRQDQKVRFFSVCFTRSYNE